MQGGVQAVHGGIFGGDRQRDGAGAGGGVGLPHPGCAAASAPGPGCGSKFRLFWRQQSHLSSISNPISDPIVEHRSPRPGGAAAAAPEPEQECVCIEP